jgi:cytochrome c oxidase subunit IV
MVYQPSKWSGAVVFAMMVPPFIVALFLTLMIVGW